MGAVTTFVMSLLHGLVYGMVLFLLASGLTLIFGMMGVLNFAHGALYMLGAYVSFSILVWTGQFWLSLIVAPVVVAFVGMFMERFFLRKVHGYGHVSELLLTFGVAYILEDIVKLVWGTEPMKVDIPALLSGVGSHSRGAFSRVPALHPAGGVPHVRLSYRGPLPDPGGHHRPRSRCE